MARMSNQRAVAAMMDEEVFANNSSTMIGATRFRGWGELALPCRPNVDDVEYWVYSYDTPIAWVTQQGEVAIPNEPYSKTTDVHQDLARLAFSDEAAAQRNERQPWRQKLQKRDSA